MQAPEWQQHDDLWEMCISTAGGGAFGRVCPENDGWRAVWGLRQGDCWGMEAGQPMGTTWRKSFDEARQEVELHARRIAEQAETGQ